MLVLRSFPAALAAAKRKLEELEDRDLKRPPPTLAGALALVADRIARGRDADDDEASA